VPFCGIRPCVGNVAVVLHVLANRPIGLYSTALFAPPRIEIPITGITRTRHFGGPPSSSVVPTDRQGLKVPSGTPAWSQATTIWAFAFDIAALL
jgi:hypothetical protein